MTVHMLHGKPFLAVKYAIPQRDMSCLSL